MAWLNPGLGLARFFSGLGQVKPLDPGNTGNAPADPPLEVGTWQFLNGYALQGNGHIASDVPTTGPQWTDWGQYAVNAADLSGNTGGGAYSGVQTVLPTETDMYFDTSTGVYYNLG